MKKLFLQKGFTLIELLVVAAIIGLLASIILASLNDSKQKAQNSAKNQMAQQYVNALELYRSDNGNYPIFGDGTGNINSTNFACLGYDPGETCFGAFGVDGDKNLNDDIRNYFGELPEDQASIDSVFGNLRGVTYACKSSIDCSDFIMRWFLEGTSQNCGTAGTAELNDFVGNTRCRYVTK